MAGKRQAILEQVASMLGAWWRFPPSDDELAAIAAATKSWPAIDVVLDAVEEATRTEDQRPSVAWIIRNAERRLKLRDASSDRGEPSKPGCRLCRGELFIVAAGGSPLDDPRVSPLDCELKPCPRCAQVSHNLWKAGAYEMDAPRSAARFAAIEAEAKASR
jgi:hypothetical protein